MSTTIKVKANKPSLEGRPRLITRKISLRQDQEDWLIAKGQAGLAINEFIRNLIDERMKEDKKTQSEFNLRQTGSQ